MKKNQKMKETSSSCCSLLFFVVFCLLSVSVPIAEASKKKNVASAPQGVTYDGRSLIVNGKRELIFSGAIHYPRSTPDQWSDLISKAKRGGLNTIETYVFWNIHEPVQGQFNFEGQYDLVKFIRMIQEHDMHVIIRLGPFIQAEWNNGGLPYWLREIPGIIFRSDNAPFKSQMQKWITKIIDLLRGEKLFAREGGPIILAQIENEYNTIQLAYRELGNSYIQWAANLAISFDVGVPWVMCKQYDAPDPVINTCNGRQCGDTFPGPNRPNKPSLWTENWTAQFRVFGDPPSQRAAEDIAFAVSRFFSKNGTLTNYYMYHGGTNFGRTAAHFVTTRYYDEAPLDEYGLQREPKWGHLKDLHRALNLCKKPLLNGVPRVEKLGIDVEDSGAYMEKRFAGPRSVEILGLNTGTLDITNNEWGHQVGLDGEKVRVYTQGGSHRVDWNKLEKKRPALSWYKAYFDPPEGTEPVAVRMNNMGKGMIWVNGKSIGRHWMSFLSPLGQPTQSEYHIPRSYLKPSDNLLVILEEEEGVRPEDIEIVTVNRDTICSYVQENAPPPVTNWEVKANKFRFVGDGKTVSQLKCPKKKKIVAVEFASFGNPIGSCSSFILGNCSSAISKEVVEKHCLGKGSCQVPVDRAIFDDKKPDPCHNTLKTLAVQVKCAASKNKKH
ncbi:hypothetical protein Dsin_025357 [Dipteronia sinensis]|uniref:Beta-galactosidase n=1 Tax=Dipteronia sinensis TaxID=43782 RepID=A0AAD9ZVP5_9ROSI|nr:hypothetical protein Dsin_025357 [Dipteronia sinensis]